MCTRGSIRAPACGPSTSLLERMSRTASTLVPFVSAAAVPAAIVWVFYVLTSHRPAAWGAGFFYLLLACLLVVVVLFAPGLLLLHWSRRLTRSSVLIVAFVSGCLPAAVFSWPRLHSGPTYLGIPMQVYVLLFFGICGAAGGLAYWATVRAFMRSNNRWSGPWEA